MANYSFLKDYIFTEKDPKAKTSKHAFYKLNEDDITSAEERLGFEFPSELRQFYSEVGYGFMCCADNEMVDRFMDPGSVADFSLCEGMFEGNEEGELYEDNFLVIFEVSEVSLLALDLSAENSKGQCPVYYFDTKVADSLEEFLLKMDKDTDYYMDVEEDD